MRKTGDLIRCALFSLMVFEGSAVSAACGDALILGSVTQAQALSYSRQMASAFQARWQHSQEHSVSAPEAHTARHSEQIRSEKLSGLLSSLPLTSAAIEWVKFADQVLTEEQGFVDFIEDVSEVLALARAKSGDALFDPTTGAPVLAAKPSATAFEAFRELLDRAGFPPLIGVKPNLAPVEFLDLVSSARPFYDVFDHENPVQSVHGSTSHALQYLYLKPRFDRRFGTGSFEQFLELFGPKHRDIISLDHQSRLFFLVFDWPGSLKPTGPTFFTGSRLISRDYPSYLALD